MIELLVCTLIWGMSFVAQKLGADHFGPFSINCYRNLLAGAFLASSFAARGMFKRKVVGEWSKKSAFGAVLSGFCVVAAEITQQLGVERTTPGVCAFLTANYVLIVPILAMFLGKRTHFGVWGGVILALLGTFLICFTSSGFEIAQLANLELGVGEAWTLLCAVLFAIQIIVVDHFAPNCDMLRFSMVQMSAAGLIALPFVFLPSELARASWDGFVKGLPALGFLGILSSGIAYTLQNLGQAKVPAALACIIMSLEGVFALLSGWLVLGETMSIGQLCGCALILAAVIFSQICHCAPRRKNAIIHQSVQNR